ncbi:uncharacterized protein DFL_009077 [Arthrobotrys flagrans]|uniref:Uncharacterized protein n=1 Tax=Arthrobotrys flagrans TaxID=97331 RepID=A0A436ZQT0_ARTFL|nr:hypothetical protein DFL_009077 [Arthrobotrys flagrans]
MSRPILSRLAVAANRAQFSRICGLQPSRTPSLITRSRAPTTIFQRSLIAAPKEGGPPLLQRSADRELPDVTPKRRYLIHIPIFLISMYVAANLLFNYQRSSSSVVSSTLYALRVNPEAREILGDEISFKAKTIPWIHGTMDQLHGKIDISYKVKGSKGEGTVHFLSLREGGRAGKFKTKRWALEIPDGGVLNLLVDDNVLEDEP